MVSHVPVLLKECLEILHPAPGESVLDVTLGLGGHAREFLRRIGPTGRFIGMDADRDNLRLAEDSLNDFAGTTTFIHANFRSLPECLPEDRRTFDVILADIGLSSAHVDDPARGFSFRTDAPLDLRFDRTSGMTAAALLSSLDPATLASAFHRFGELPRVRSLVDAIVRTRTDHPILRTNELAALVRDVYGYRAPSVMPQVFQALRILTNDELGSLERLLGIGPSLLSPGGRIGIISFHSLEDRLVKQSFRAYATAEKDPVTGAPTGQAPFTLLTPRAVRPSAGEIQRNPRSRSASLRALSASLLYTSSRT